MTTPVSYVFLLNILADLVSAAGEHMLDSSNCERRQRMICCKGCLLHILHVYIATMSLGVILHTPPALLTACLVAILGSTCFIPGQRLCAVLLIFLSLGVLLFEGCRQALAAESAQPYRHRSRLRQAAGQSLHRPFSLSDAGAQTATHTRGCCKLGCCVIT